MNLFEYQGKELFSKAGIPVPKGIIVKNADETPDIDGGRVVKAQVLTGGRGKAGAIKKCDTNEEIKQAVRDILAMKVKGHSVKAVLIEELSSVKEEYYFSIAINRKNKNFIMMFSRQGGIEVESLAADKFTTVEINPVIGLRPYMIKELLLSSGLDGNEQLKEVIEKSYELFTLEKMQLLEMNPVALTAADEIMVLDSKIVLDDNYLSGSVEFSENESGSLTPVEAKIAQYGATGVELDGDIAVVCAGAGVSMATADSIVRKGGSVRLIFDTGTLPSDSSDESKRIWASNAYAAVLDLNPKVILFNEFYQAGRLDYEAMTIKYVMEEAAERIPVIFRCKGRMAEAANEIHKDTKIYITESYEDACDMAIKAAKEGITWR